MRDLKKAITEYESLDKRNGQHTFYLSDIYGIEDIAREHSGGVEQCSSTRSQRHWRQATSSDGETA